MKNWNWPMIFVVISGVASVSSVLVGCSAEIPAYVPSVIVAESSEGGQRSYQRKPAAVVPATDLQVESGKAEDGNFYARIVDKKHGVICYSVTPSTSQMGAGISCLRQ